MVQSRIFIEIEYIFEPNVAHMDIKSANIFRHLDNSSCQYKIGDLGHVCPHNERVFEDGDCRYAAREIIQDMQIKSSKNENDLRQSDMFSFGNSIQHRPY